MAGVKIILQGATQDRHADAVKALLGGHMPDRVILSMAFVTEEGVDAIESALKRVAAQSTFFAGIRNNVTTLQGLQKLLSIGLRLYAVDTAVRIRIFHPKVVLRVDGEGRAQAIIGSANMTPGGLFNNIEVSTLIDCDPAVQDDRTFIERLEGSFRDLQRDHPKHVFRIEDDDQLQKLFEEGRLVDEQAVEPPGTRVTTLRLATDTLTPMSLPPVVRRRRVRPAAPAGPAAPAPLREELKVVWESGPLVARDLNLKGAAGTNKTGSMGLKKGATTGIDQRHYFRDTVFKELAWVRDAKRKHMEHAEVQVELVIKNVNYGVFTLRLSHNSDRESATYQQKNIMTHLQWGQAVSLVANKSLLGRTARLFRTVRLPPRYLLEID